MIRKIVFDIFIVAVLGVLSACEQNKVYTYIEVIEVNAEKGNPLKKFKTGKILKAKTDSAAYVKAFVDFCISREVYRRSSASAKFSYRPVDFIIQNENGEDISKSITFHDKINFEETVQKDLRKLVLSNP